MKNVLFIKARQNPFYRGLMLKLDRSWICRELRNQVFRSDYTHILEYLYRISFLKTLDIYKDYFKGRHKVVAIVVTCIVFSEIEIALVHLSLCRSYCVFMPRVLWRRSFLIFIVNELKNLAVNNPSQVGVLVTYWDLCIIG